MASTLTVSAPDARELGRDLDSAAGRSAHEVRKVRRAAADLVARRARLLTPVGPGPRVGAKNPNDRLPHIRDTITGRPAGVVSSHPGAVVHEFGGTIAPNGGAIAIKRSAMAERAGKQKRRNVELLMRDRFDELLRSI